MANILIIEDDNCLRENTKEILELEGYTVHTAKDGQEGIQKALHSKIDLILCDIIIPKIDGYTVLKELSSVPQTQHIPFIFMSAKSDPSQIREGMNLGADDYLTKPFEEKDLLQAICKRLEKFDLFHHLDNNPSEKKLMGIKSIAQLQKFFISEGDQVWLNRNEFLFKRDQLDRNVYYLKKGLVKTYCTDENGKELITKINRDGSFIGLYSFTNIISHSEYTCGMEYSELYQLSAELIQKIFKFNPELIMQLAQDLSDDMRQLKSHLLQTAYSSVLQKTINTLIGFTEENNFKTGELTKITRQDLANLAGITKESFIRSLAILRDQGLINIEARNIEIVDLAGLKKMRG